MGLTKPIRETKLVKRKTNQRTRTAGQLKWRHDIQQIWLSGDDDKLYRAMQGRIVSKARFYGKRYSNFHINQADVESMLWELTWEITMRPFDPDSLPFMDVWDIAVKRRMVTLLKQMRPRVKYERGGVKYVTVEVHDHRYFDEEISHMLPAKDVETEVINRLTVQQMCNDERLTDRQRYLLVVMLDNPDATLQELAEIVGEQRRDTVYKRIKAIRDKLRDERLNN